MQLCVCVCVCENHTRVHHFTPCPVRVRRTQRGPVKLLVPDDREQRVDLTTDGLALAMIPLSAASLISLMPKELLQVT